MNGMTIRNPRRAAPRLGYSLLRLGETLAVWKVPEDKSPKLREVGLHPMVRQNDWTHPAAVGRDMFSARVLKML